jgi:hypothetical protein
MKVAKSLLENEYYNAEEKLHNFVSLFFDNLTRCNYNEESLTDCHEIITETKNICAECLNEIILEYGTKYQTLLPKLFEQVAIILSEDKKTYLSIYGPLKMISLQTVYYSGQCEFYLNSIKEVLQHPMSGDFKEE